MKATFKEKLIKIHYQIIAALKAGKWLALAFTFCAVSIGVYFYQAQKMIMDQANVISAREREVLFLTQENARLQKTVLPPPELQQALNQKEVISKLETENQMLKSRVLQWKNYCESKTGAKTPQ